jgi:hypothetical protein
VPPRADHVLGVVSPRQRSRGRTWLHARAHRRKPLGPTGADRACAT